MRAELVLDYLVIYEGSGGDGVDVVDSVDSVGGGGIRHGGGPDMRLPGVARAGPDMRLPGVARADTVSKEHREVIEVSIDTIVVTNTTCIHTQIHTHK
jgi:hypothetical protein